MTPQATRTAKARLPELAPFRERRWIGAVLALGDVVALESAFLLGYLLRRALLVWYPVKLGPAQLHGIAFGLLFLPLAYLLAGLYPGYGLNALERFRIRMKTGLTVFATLIVWDYIILHGSWSRGVLLASAALALTLPVAMESVLIRRLTRLGCWGTPVVILCSGQSGEAMVERLARRTESGLVPAFLVDHSEWFGGRGRELWSSVRIAVLAIPGLGRKQLEELLEALPFPQVIVAPEFAGLESQWITVVDLGGTLGLELKRNLLLRHVRFVKRALDLLLALPLLALSAPLLAVLVVWIKRVSPGPAFYRQKREGHRGTTIQVWKLRSMQLNAETLLEQSTGGNPEQAREWAAGCKLRNDPRILPGVGRVLRRWSLDELPQLWNVLRGEMSLVGPRPFPFYHLEHFDSEFCRLRRQVRPGLTGLWQVSARADSDLAMQESLDTYYIRNWSLWMDFHILASTFRAVVSGKGAY